jgi:hypothetical protein
VALDFRFFTFIEREQKLSGIPPTELGRHTSRSLRGNLSPEPACH